MKIQELRVGNWYHSVKFGVPVQCELSDLYELCARSDGAYNDPPIDEMFEPIPLTEEWLLKFGAKSTELSPAKNGIWITSEIDNQGCWVSISHGVGVVVVNILYVHQLQNLYFVLTGNELEIK
jgi:hypothetical protein